MLAFLKHQLMVSSVTEEDHTVLPVRESIVIDLVLTSIANDLARYQATDRVSLRSCRKLIRVCDPLELCLIERPLTRRLGQRLARNVMVGG
jgi:hypothetical protein